MLRRSLNEQLDAVDLQMSSALSGGEMTEGNLREDYPVTTLAKRQRADVAIFARL